MHVSCQKSLEMMHNRDPRHTEIRCMVKDVLPQESLAKTLGFEVSILKVTGDNLL